ncbi:MULTISPECIES: hypothetical protein [Gammaproteobacteria]|uniref:hypothetical protein n=1 Tax=Gammaproteobacteria TaxID=1236 RepID=UPI0018666452|nr:MULTISPECIES: hypothetical protein [Gammaproteobacteria]
MRASDLLLDFGRPVAYFPGLVKRLGSVNAVIFFSQIFYWQDKADSKLGVYKTSEEIESETGLSYREQLTARKHLVSRGILIETNKRLEHKIYYLIDCEKLDSVMSQPIENAPNAQSATGESHNSDFAEQQNERPRQDKTDGGGETNPQFDPTEITTYITTDNKTPSCPVASQPDKNASDQLFITRHPEAVVFSAKKRQWGTADDLLCAQWIFKRVMELYDNASESDSDIDPPKEPNWALWANEVRLMRTIDGRTHRQICKLFNRVNKDPFWCKNVLSPSTLRKQWDKLVLKFAEISHDENCTSDQVHWNSPEAWGNTL